MPGSRRMPVPRCSRRWSRIVSERSVRPVSQRRKSYEAYAADGLVAMAEASASRDMPGRRGPKVMVQVRVDHAAWVRGHTEAGEVCEIPEAGPIPVATARALASDSILSAVVTKGS